MLNRVFISIIIVLTISVSANAEFYRNIDPQNEEYIDVLVTYTQETINLDFGSVEVFKQYIDHEMVLLNALYILSGLKTGYFRLLDVIERDTSVSNCDQLADIVVNIIYKDQVFASAMTLVSYTDPHVCKVVTMAGKSIMKVGHPNTPPTFQHEISHTMGALHAKINHPETQRRLSDEMFAFMKGVIINDYEMQIGDMMAVSSQRFPFISNVENEWGGMTWGKEGESNVMAEINARSFAFTRDNNPSPSLPTETASPSDVFPDGKITNHWVDYLPKYDSNGHRLVYFPENFRNAAPGSLFIHPEGMLVGDGCPADPSTVERYYIMRAFNGTTWSEPFKMETPVNPCTGLPWADDPPEPPKPPKAPDMTAVYQLLLLGDQ